MYWYLDAFRHYADFTSLTQRRAFWMFAFISVLISLFIATIEILTNNPGWLDLIYSVIALIPTLAITVRRLRDTGLSLWWFLVLLIPGFGVLIMLVLLSLPSQNYATHQPKEV